MKVLILLGLVAVSQAVSVYYHPGAWYPASTAYQAKDSIGNYAFGHHAALPNGPSFHTEAGDASGRKIGSYGLKDADGQVRVVEYVADHGGFRANIKTSEKLAEDHQDPANVKVTEAKHVFPVVYGYPYAYLG